MKYDTFYEQSTKAIQLEVVLKISSLLSMMIAIVMLLGRGLANLYFIIFALAAIGLYALAWMTNMLIEIYGLMGRIEEKIQLKNSDNGGSVNR